jgi:hypothetical protein
MHVTEKVTDFIIICEDNENDTSYKHGDLSVYVSHSNSQNNLINPSAMELI